MTAVDSVAAPLASLYARPLEGRHVRAASPTEPLPPVAEFVYDSFRALVLNDRFSCLGARSAFGKERYRMGLYEQMAGAESTQTLAQDLATFARDSEKMGPGFTTFVACFKGPAVLTEREFEGRLWAQLGALNGVDAEHHSWDPSVSSDPDDPQFAFSFGGRAYFVVGLHAGSSRWTRRFAWPTLVFNDHRQFRGLREAGRFTRMQAVIRDREQALQGSLNPNLGDFGVRSEARQYSGRAVEEDWGCPFRPASAKSA